VTTPVPCPSAALLKDPLGTYLGSKDTLHRQDVNLLLETESRANFGTEKLGSNNVSDFGELTPLAGESSLESHIACRTLGDEEQLVVAGLEETILEGRANVTVGLSVPVMRLNHFTPLA
jgi:hypothetical protein